MSVRGNRRSARGGKRRAKSRSYKAPIGDVLDYSRFFKQREWQFLEPKNDDFRPVFSTKSENATPHFTPQTYTSGTSAGRVNERISPIDKLQRATVKASYGQHGGDSPGASLKAHYYYLVDLKKDRHKGKDDKEIVPFDEHTDLTKECGASLCSNWAKDKHHFRLMISPEHGKRLDLKSYTRKYMNKLSEELDTKLQWIAVVHENTANPHVHVVLRGLRDDGQNLRISKKRFFKGGRLRGIASELATEILGPRTRREIIRGKNREIKAKRFTSLDAKLLKEFAKRKTRQINLFVDLKSNIKGGEVVARRLRKRVAFLTKEGVIKKVGFQKYVLPKSFEKSLRALGRRGDISKQLFEKYTLKKEAFIYLNKDTEPSQHRTIRGVVLKSGIEDELIDRRFILLQGTDGEKYYVSLGKFDVPEGVLPGKDALVEIGEKRPFERQVDKRIRAFLKEKEGNVFDTSDFAKRLPTNMSHKMRDDYLSNVLKRLETLCKQGLASQASWYEYEVKDSFLTPPKQKNRKKRFIVRELSSKPLETLIDEEGLTGLDVILAAENESLQSINRAKGKGHLRFLNALSKRSKRLQNGTISKQSQNFISPSETTIRDLYEVTLKKCALRKGGSLVKLVGEDSKNRIFRGEFLGLTKLSCGTHAVFRSTGDELVICPFIKGMERLKKNERVQLRHSGGRALYSSLEKVTKIFLSYHALSREKSVDSDLNRRT